MRCTVLTCRGRTGRAAQSISDLPSEVKAVCRSKLCYLFTATSTYSLKSCGLRAHCRKGRLWLRRIHCNALVVVAGTRDFVWRDVGCDSRVADGSRIVVALSCPLSLLLRLKRRCLDYFALRTDSASCPTGCERAPPRVAGRMDEAQL